MRSWCITAGALTWVDCAVWVHHCKCPYLGRLCGRLCGLSASLQNPYLGRLCGLGASLQVQVPRFPSLHPRATEKTTPAAEIAFTKDASLLAGKENIRDKKAYDYNNREKLDKRCEPRENCSKPNL